MKLLHKTNEVVVGAIMSLLATSIAPSIAQQNTKAPEKLYSDRYTNQKDAEARAREIGCNGTYRNGQFWMPCGNSMMYRNCWDRYYKK
jgi:hypothetical protein